jgi:hypothetical protein
MWVLLVTTNAVLRLYRPTLPTLSALVVARPVRIDLFVPVALVPHSTQRPSNALHNALHKNAGNTSQIVENVHVSLGMPQSPRLRACRSLQFRPIYGSGCFGLVPVSFGTNH